MSKTIFVYENWTESSPNLIGKLFVNNEKNSEMYSFEFDENYIKSKSAIQLDPDLYLYQGRQFTPFGKAMFGIFSDSCPDRWGRMLLKRKEAIMARRENKKPKKLNESDFLLGVYDESRMGALRFSLNEGKTFESSDSGLATPPFVDLRELEAASLALENDESGLNEKWLDKLLAPGSSLGGARPKATVKDVDGSLWIAKFPSKTDQYNSGAWEMVVHDLATLCNLNVPKAKLINLSKNGSTFAVKRFDRTLDRRIHFASAMTLLGKTDGSNDVSYLDLAAFIKAQGNNPKADLQELFKRLVFNMAVSNTDDHLRNHGFLLHKKNWILSPAFDINPVPYGNSLSLAIDSTDSSIDLNLAIETARFYDIPREQAVEIVSAITGIVSSNWRRIAKQYNISQDAVEQMRPAFTASFDWPQ